MEYGENAVLRLKISSNGLLDMYRRIKFIVDRIYIMEVGKKGGVRQNNSHPPHPLGGQPRVDSLLVIQVTHPPPPYLIECRGIWGFSGLENAKNAPKKPSPQPSVIEDRGNFLFICICTLVHFSLIFAFVSNDTLCPSDNDQGLEVPPLNPGA